MIGERLRRARHAQQLSLTAVAGRADISAATLSRIENEKQSVDLDMLFLLSGILDVSPEELVGTGEGRRSSNERRLADQIASLSSRDRTRLWRDLAQSRKRARGVHKEVLDIDVRIEELLAQVDFLRQEIESVRTRLKKRT